MLLKTSGYVKSYDGQTKWIYFLIENDDLLHEYDTFGDKVNGDAKEEFGSEPVYNKEFLKTETKSHGGEVTDFYDKKFHKVDSNHTCLGVISLHSALNKDGNYNLLVFFKRVYIQWEQNN